MGSHLAIRIKIFNTRMNGGCYAWVNIFYFIKCFKYINIFLNLY